MKKVLFIFIGITVCLTVFTQTPNAFKYQAVLRDAAGTIMAEENVTLGISILKSDLTTSVFDETHNLTTTKQGLVNINIGSIEDLSSIDWSTDNYYIEIKVNGPIISTSQLLSVPYAMHARSVENITEHDPDYNAWNKSYIDLINTPNIIDSINAVIDTTTQFIRTEIDGDVTNEIQNLSQVLSQSNLANAQIKNITDPSEAQDAATKAYVDLLLERIYLLEQINGVEESVTDYDGNKYKTARIGEQVWMAENLKTTHYANGEEIPDGTGAGDIVHETDPKYWFSYADDLNNISTYGRLYTWYTVTDSRNVCPDGWHVPTDDEWTSLTTFLGGESIAGGKLKEIGVTHWTTPNTEATNETRFTALPGGWRNPNGPSYLVGDEGNWWSTTDAGPSDGLLRNLRANSSSVYRNVQHRTSGFSVRCLRD